MNDSILFYLAAMFGFRIAVIPGFGYAAAVGGVGRTMMSIGLGRDPLVARGLLLEAAARMGRGAQA